jgi:hypothetical protein
MRELPVFGAVSAPSSVLTGAWVGDGTDHGRDA